MLSCRLYWTRSWLHGRIWAQNTKHSICSVIKMFKNIVEVSWLNSSNCRVKKEVKTFDTVYTSQVISSIDQMHFLACLSIYRRLVSFLNMDFQGRSASSLLSTPWTFEEWYKLDIIHLCFGCFGNRKHCCICFLHFHCFSFMYATNTKGHLVFALLKYLHITYKVVCLHVFFYLRLDPIPSRV